MNSKVGVLVLFIALLVLYFVQPGVIYACTPGMTFVSDVTVPDDTHFKPGVVFQKTWNVKNTGSCDWTDRYTIAFAGGDQFGANSSVYPMNGTVAPGEEAEIWIKMQAPGTDGVYTSRWQLKDETNQPVGDTFYVRVVVGNASPTAADGAAGRNQTWTGNGSLTSSRFHLSTGVTLFRMQYDGMGNFVVWLWSDTGAKSQLITNVTGSFDKLVPVDIQRAGTYWLDVSADADWQITLAEKADSATADVSPPTPTPAPAPTPVTSGEPPSSSRHLLVGSEARLYVGGDGKILLGVDKQSLSDIMQAVSADDSYGLVDLILAGRIFMVENNTRVKIIELGFMIDKVRILEGSQTGRAGWVPMEFVR